LQYILNIDMKEIFNTMFLFTLLVITGSCSNEDLVPVNGEQKAGKVVIRSYNALQDSLQIVVNGKPLEIGNHDAFVKRIVKDYEFVFYDNQVKNIEIINKATREKLHSYNFSPEFPIDTLSFYHKEGIWIDEVLANRPGTLSGTGRTGYRFIFPTMNRHSNSGYDGPVDAIIRKVNGQLMGIAENITKENFSPYVEFAYGAPPILQVELVKHGTQQSYINGQQVIIQMVMQNNKSRLIVLEEKANVDGSFSGIDGTINLADYFDF